jgi:hypothetical protein
MREKPPPLTRLGDWVPSARSVLVRAWRSRPTPFVLLLALLATMAGWISRLRPAAADWGDVATWIAGVGTILALVIAAAEFNRSSIQASKETQESSDRAQKERQESMATQYLADAYLAVCKVAGTSDTYFATDEVVGDLENAVNAAELFGSPKVRADAGALIDTFRANGGSYDFGPLKYALRDELRERLGFDPVEEETTHLVLMTGPRLARIARAKKLYEQHRPNS